MRRRIPSSAIVFLAFAMVATVLRIPVAAAQNAAPRPNAPASYSQGQLDQLTSPIALYPDSLLSQILMAASYPLELVEADRWVQDPNNAALAGDDLTAALGGLPWDPSVKSLVAYPPVLGMMDGNLQWTEALGDAVVSDLAGVMDSIQRLRASAQSGGYLSSNPQETVSQQGQDIVVAPASPDTLYVPDCDPSIVYGAWPWPDDPPYYFTGYYPEAAFNSYGCEWWGTAIFTPYWGWNSWDWLHHGIVINRARFTALNGKRPPPGKNNNWQADPARRHNVSSINLILRERLGAMATAAGTAGSARGSSRALSPPRHISRAVGSFRRGRMGHAVAMHGRESQTPTRIGNAHAPPGSRGQR